MMKRLISIVVAAAMLLSVSTSVFAASEDSTQFEKLVLTVKERLNIDDSVYIFDNYSKNGSSVNFVWKSRDSEKNGRLSVSINDDGDILNYHLYNDKEQEKYNISQRASDEKIKEAAYDFLKMATPKKSQNFKFDSISTFLNSDISNVSFARYENDIPVEGSFANVDINPYTLEISSYNMNFSDIESFDDGASVINREDAIKAYKDKLGYELLYRTYYDNDKSKAFLTYSSKMGASYVIDAKTGEVFRQDDRYDFKKESMASADSAGGVSANQAARLSEEEKAVLDKIKGLPSKEEIISMAKEVKEFEVSDKFITTDFGVYKHNGNYAARVSFEAADEDNRSYKSVELNLETGEIISYYTYDGINKTNDSEKLDSKTLKETCEKFVNKYYSKRTGELRRMENNENENEVCYQRTVDKIGVNGDGIRVYADEVTGKIINVSFNFSDAEFQNILPTAKSLDDLYEKILTEEDFKLKYVLVPVENSDKYTAKLVYKLSTDYFYDVNTLEKLNYNGTVKRNEKFKGYADIENHYVKDYAIALGNVGIYFDEEKLRPDDNITQIDFVRLLARECGYFSDNDEYIYKIAKREFLDGDKKDENAAVTRMDAVRYAVNSRGYKDIAKIPSIYKTHFSDVSEEMIGYAALGTGLKIVSDKSDVLNCSENLTRADALIIIYNLMNN